MKSSIRKILLVDPDAATRFLITEILEGANVTIIACESGKKARPLFKKHAHDLALVLLCIYLPDCNGCGLLKEFRQEMPAVPVLAVAAMPPNELAKAAKAAGFDGYVSKPFGVGEFVEVIMAYL